jgi:hypothetical protein
MLFITRRCENTLKELSNYRWDRFASSKIEARRNKKEVPLKKNDHCLDALRYGIMSRPVLEGEEYDGPVGNILDLPVAGPKDMDYELCFTTPEREMSIEW